MNTEIVYLWKKATYSVNNLQGVFGLLVSLETMMKNNIKTLTVCAHGYEVDGIIANRVKHNEPTYYAMVDNGHFHDDGSFTHGSTVGGKYPNTYYAGHFPDIMTIISTAYRTFGTDGVKIVFEGDLKHPITDVVEETRLKRDKVFVSLRRSFAGYGWCAVRTNKDGEVVRTIDEDGYDRVHYLLNDGTWNKIAWVHNDLTAYFPTLGALEEFVNNNLNAGITHRDAA